VGKPAVDCLFVIIEFFGWYVMSRNLSKSAFFEYGWSLWAQICHTKTRVISLSCGIKISAVCSFFSSQSTRRLWLTYAWMDRQNYDCQDRASIAASRGKQKSVNSAFMNLGTRGPRDDTTFENRYGLLRFEIFTRTIFITPKTPKSRVNKHFQSKLE